MCDGLGRTDFDQFPLWVGVLVLNELIFQQFLLSEGVVILKELIFNSFYVGRVWWHLERTDF